MDRVRALILDRFGGVDIVIAFAGGYSQPVPTIQETAEHWWYVVDSDLTATFLHLDIPAGTDRALRHCRHHALGGPASQPRRGRVHRGKGGSRGDESASGQ
ncbi:hypothetical protein [Nocardia sp. SYP-A9097]|uniref:hypothetical protein n=1 Tax=Nocardia sp. SYP-A9097 TaxID=2663237 RepID=UPI0021052E1A|nr:hypothetical protein [Nocardia sp. SYP-A9097]